MASKKAEIVSVARELHAMHGDAGVSMRNIAGKLGVTPTALYRHYRDKEAVMAAVVADVRRYPEDFAAHRSPSFDALRTAVEQEMRNGKLRRDNALETTLTIWSHAHGLISMYTLGRFGDDAEAFCSIYRSSVRRLYRGVAVPKTKGVIDETRAARRPAAAVRRPRTKR
jgi:AcrR family transcriptional regulator